MRLLVPVLLQEVPPGGRERLPVSWLLFAPKALFEQGEKADAGSRKKSVRLDIDMIDLNRVSTDFGQNDAISVERERAS